MRTDIKLGQLYDDNTGQFLDKTIFMADIPEQFVDRKEWIDARIGGPELNSYYNLLDNTLLERDQRLSVVTGLVRPLGTMKVLDQVTENVFQPKVSMFFSYARYNKSINVSRSGLNESVVLNRDYLATTNATHFVKKISYGTRYLLITNF